MQRYTHLFSLCLVLALLFCAQDTYAVTFYRNLTIGDTGSDVLELQKLLNTRTETTISLSGPGSRGSETMYFGPLTASAVAKYQELYASSILAPLGLFSGTGFVGTATIRHLNIEGVDRVSDPESDSFEVGGIPKITSLYPSQGGVGTVVKLYGEGFLEEGNHVVTAFEDFGEVSSNDGETLEITIKGPFPEEFLKKNAEFYKKEKFTMNYQIAVMNDSGNSNFVSFTFLFYE